MPFDAMSKLKNPMGTLKEATETLANVGMEKTQELLGQINLLLQLLQSAGYGVASGSRRISIRRGEFLRPLWVFTVSPAVVLRR